MQTTHTPSYTIHHIMHMLQCSFQRIHDEMAVGIAARQPEMWPPSPSEHLGAINQGQERSEQPNQRVMKLLAWTSTTSDQT